MTKSELVSALAERQPQLLKQDVERKNDIVWPTLEKGPSRPQIQ